MDLSRVKYINNAKPTYGEYLDWVNGNNNNSTYFLGNVKTFNNTDAITNVVQNDQVVPTLNKQSVLSNPVLNAIPKKSTTINSPSSNNSNTTNADWGGAISGVFNTAGAIYRNGINTLTPSELVGKNGVRYNSIDGILYELYNDINADQEMESIERDTKIGALLAAGTGAAAGAAIGSVIPGFGTVAGGVVGGLIGGIGGLFSGSSKEEEAERAIAEAKQRLKIRNQISFADAKTKASNKRFAETYGDLDASLILYSAKEGKPSGVNPNTGNTYKTHTVNTAYGKMQGKQNSWLNKGEVVWAKGDFLPGFEFGKPGLFKVKEGPNDTARGYIRPGDVVFSKDVINPETGNAVADDVELYAGINQLDRLEYNLELGKDIMNMKTINKYRRMPKLKFGLDGNFVSTVASLLGSLSQYNEASKDLRETNIYAPNQYETAALNLLDSLSLPYLPVYKQNKQIEAQNRRAIAVSGGLSAGQKASAYSKLAYNTQLNNLNALFDIMRQNNSYKATAANAKLQAGESNARRKMQANMFDEEMLAKAHNAAVQGRQMSLFNAINALLQYYKNNWQDKTYRDTLSMYRDDLNERKAERIAKYNNIGTNNITPSSVTYSNLQPYLYNGIGSGIQLGPGLGALDLSKFKRYAR